VWATACVPLFAGGEHLFEKANRIAFENTSNPGNFDQVDSCVKHVSIDSASDL
jgi:hypothetical protein